MSKAPGDTGFSQAIFITHSPLVLSTARANAFFMDGGAISPLDETFGQDANQSLINMDARDQSEKVERDFKSYLDLIQEGAGESDSASV